VQAMIRYHHGKLQQFIWQPIIFGLLLLDLFQILIQLSLINQIIDKAASQIYDDDDNPQWAEWTSEDGQNSGFSPTITFPEVTDPDIGNAYIVVNILSVLQGVLILQRLYILIKNIVFQTGVKAKTNPIETCGTC
jgi:hypothetical protein